MTKYASKTSVPVDRSMGQVRQILSKNGADGVAIAETREVAMVQFVFENMPYKFLIHYPNGKEDHIRFTDSGRERTEHQVESEIDSEKRRLWRSMVLYIKAAIEAHLNGLVNIKRSMMGNIMLDNGTTMYQRLERDLDKARSNPSMLLG